MQSVSAYDRFHEILREVGVDPSHLKGGPASATNEDVRRAHARIDAEFNGRMFFTTFAPPPLRSLTHSVVNTHHKTIMGIAQLQRAGLRVVPGQC
jgi:hypothetical protein